jgi:PAS domain S-box-containing protein
MISAMPSLPPDIQSVIIRNPLKVTAQTLVRTAIALMSGHHPASISLGQNDDATVEVQPSSYVLAMDGDHLLGLLTERDVVRLCAQGQSLDVPICEVMTQPVFTLKESACQDVLSAIAFLQMRNIRHVPVLDHQDRLVGLLTQEDLQKSDLICPALAATAAAGIFYLTADASCTYVSERWCQIVGISPNQATGHGWIESLHPDDRSAVLTEWAVAVQTNRQFKLEFRFQNSAGQSVWVYGSAIAQSARDEIVGYVGTIADISDRKQIEQALQTQIEFDRLIADIASRFIQLSTSNISLGINQALQEIGEFTAVDTTYIFQYSSCKTMRSMTYEWVMPGLEPNIHRLQDLPVDLFPWATCLLNQGQAVYIPSVSSLLPEAADDQKSFEQFGVVSMLAIPLIDQGEVIGCVGFASLHQERCWSSDNIRLLKIFADILTNLLQRQQAEAELQDSERRYASLAEAAPVGIFRFGADVSRLYTNERWSQMTGLSAEASQTMRWVSAVHPDDRDRIIRDWLQTVKTQTRFQSEFRLQRPDGTVTWVLGQAIPECSVTGEASSYIGTLTDITDRKEAEAKRLQTEYIRNERNLFETLFEVILGGYWDWDIQNQHEYLSPGFKRMFGYEDDELPNNPGTWKSLILSDDLAKVLDGFDHHFQSHGKVPFCCEAQYRHKNGSAVWVICTGQVIEWDAAGNPLRMIGCHIDISDQKQNEKALANYAREVEDLYNNAPCGYHSLDGAGKVININDTALKWLGYSRNEAIGKSFTEFISPDKISMFEAYFLEFKRSGRVKDLDFDILCKDGSFLPVFLNSIAVEDSQGRFLYSRATLFDARDRKRAEKISRVNQERLELALEGSGDGVWDWDIEADEVYLSPRWLEMLGYKEGELPPKIDAWLLLVHPEDKPHVAATFQGCIQGGSVPYAFEYRMQHRSGDWRWIANFGKIVARDPTGQPQRLVGIHRDITAQKLAEHRIQETSNQLAATNLELESFSYSVSHDLRAPLRHVSGFVSALRQQLEQHQVLGDAKVTHYLNVIEKSSQKMGRLIDGLLTLSRMGRRPLVQQQVSLRDLVEEAIMLTQPANLPISSSLQKNTRSNTKSSVDFAVSDLPVISGDRTLLQQAFQNLIENAVKFSQKAAVPRVEIGSSPDGTIWVRDNGAGFQMEYADKLFGAFQRLHDQSEFEGTGIGLAVVQRIVQRHGGTIWAEAKPGQGATFFLRFRDESH